jgi:hypothetical protein
VFKSSTISSASCWLAVLRIQISSIFGYSIHRRRGRNREGGNYLTSGRGFFSLYDVLYRLTEFTAPDQD